MLMSCSSRGNSEHKILLDSQPKDSTISVPLTAEELEIIRRDSIRTVALVNDSLKGMHIVIDKTNCMLYLCDNDSLIFETEVCVGKGIGQKQRKGDHKTPEGTYKVVSILDSSRWPHDFHDGRGQRTDGYGPWFLRLDTPQSEHIGIHGTCFPESMGKRESDGCVRMRNEDLLKLKEYVTIGLKVVINPDEKQV